MNIKVLLVEDDKMARKRLKRVIEKEGYEVIAAQDGLEGLELFKSERPDVVITDVKMPKIDGIEVMHRIKEMSKTTEVILITGHGDIDMAIVALRDGALDYIKKPIDIDQLIVSLGRAKEKIQDRKKITIRNSILILEDDEKTREKLGKIYIKEGYKVFTAPDGERGLKIFSENKIDILLTDLRMPIMNGLQFISEVKKISSDCEFIVLSGFGDEADAVEAMRNGAINFISKPIDLEQLLLSTQKAIDKLELQRSYYYKTRELELTKQIMKRISSERGYDIEFSENSEQDQSGLVLNLIDIMNISYVLFDEKLDVGFANQYFQKQNDFLPEKIDKEFFEKLGIREIDMERFREDIDFMFKNKRSKMIKLDSEDSTKIIIIKIVLIVEGEREERGLVFIGGRN
ncbi:response regulator [Ilyobacter polytropus]|uniref:Response regulator receiver protein n=1 Tax=Ilyobacter polytropus (strain ATCC 51220 / DSM 2926 / LMG 16218 / CuHBu1) TaxID=572544 RepID=E3HD15_ILYPC|nr:response regulator [Ilyobacter polytropus]ADO84071.1 response regulator receiver protein [Ilyobacter polytropus DSM 2926]